MYRHLFCSRQRLLRQEMLVLTHEKMEGSAVFINLLWLHAGRTDSHASETAILKSDKGRLVKIHK